MVLEPGQRLGVFEILAPLGRGGMGEVYRATDTKLKRQVAIKVLPESVAADVDRLARFQREAEVLASLNHPHIAAIYGLEDAEGVKALVMELVEGPTLADRIAQGAIPVDEALPIAKQIAEALEEAHEHGIIHRDLKPANVKVREDGTVKVLDFGLAKALEPAGAASPDVSRSPTMSAQATQAGVILGTAAYMSPEQARGKPVDKRADVWAFGVVLFEMLTGKRAFEGSDVSEVMASVIKQEPDWSALPATTPHSIHRLLRRCLVKPRKDRLPDIVDARLEIDAVRTEPDPALSRPATGAQPPYWRRALPMAVAVMVGAAATTAWWSARSQSMRETPVLRAALPLPAEAAYVPRGLTQGANVAISPDGTRVVFAGGTGERLQLYLRVLDQLEVAPIAGTGGAISPFFSPDGQWVAFFADGQLKKVRIGGGVALAVCDASHGYGGVWSDDGTIVFAGALLAGLSRVSDQGGTPQPFTTLAGGEGSHRWPALVARGRDVLFAVGVESSFSWDNASVAIQSLDEGEHRVLFDGGTSPRYLPTGHIVFASAGSLLAAPFDTSSRSTVGPPVSLLQGVRTTDLMGDAHYALSTNGTLVYAPSGAEEFSRSLVWVDRAGNAEALPIPHRGFETPRLSPDGQRIALTIREGDADIWVVEPGRGMLTPLTREPGEDHSVVWHPDGRQVTYSSTRGNRSHVLLKSADGSSGEVQLFAVDQHQHLGGWTPDGLTLVTDAKSADGSDLYSWLLDEQGGPQGFIGTPFDEQNPQLSPDGHWVAYRSNDSGQSEVYVNAFPEPGGRVKISPDGGTEPVWARLGSELFYRNGDKMMAVDVEMGSTFSAGVPRVLFEGQYARVVWHDANYDVSLDDQQFLMIKEGTPDESATPPSLILVQNWFEELKRLVPTN